MIRNITYKVLRGALLALLALLAIGANANSANAEKIRVACVGNSITAGSGIRNDADKYPSQLQSLLGDEYQVRNFGISGSTAQSTADHPYTTHEAGQYQKALDFKPNIVVIKLGTNDSKTQNWTENSPEQYTQEMQAIIDAFLALDSETKIYLCYPLRALKADYGIQERNLHKIMPLIKALGEANNIPVINLHTAFELRQNDDMESLYNHNDKGELDGVHPNPKGARIIAEMVYDAITKGEYGPEKTDHLPSPQPTI